MNIAKNMEAIFIIAVTLACGINYMTMPVPQGRTTTAGMTSDANIATVTITAKRMTASEKAS